jgi:microcystin-dependent protein
MEGYIAEIRMFAATFAPRNWAYCQGQQMAISQNQALFALLGTTFGGNGVSTFALPDFRGRVAVGTGTGAGLSNIVLGEVAGSSSVSLLTSNLPAHNHILSGNTSIPVTGTIKATMNVNNTTGSPSNPKGNFLGVDQGGNGVYSTSPSSNTLNSGAIQVGGSSLGVSLASISIGNTGSSAPLSLGMPSLGMNYVICLYGIFPSRN